MLPETKAILFNFYRDYWCSTEQREKIKKIQEHELNLDDERKKKKYNVDVFGTKNVTESPIEECVALIEKKQESFFTRIINKIRRFLGKK